jgi:hypothetical protein
MRLVVRLRTTYVCANRGATPWWILQVLGLGFYRSFEIPGRAQRAGMMESEYSLNTTEVRESGYHGV